ncbi:NADH-quinone oxidoreductase subunit C, partial [Halobacteriales archaeon QS_1_68_17]
MSLEHPRPQTPGEKYATGDGVDDDALAELLGDRVLDREEHVNAEGFVIRPDDVEAVL